MLNGEKEFNSTEPQYKVAELMGYMEGCQHIAKHIMKMSDEIEDTEEFGFAVFNFAEDFLDLCPDE